MKGRNIALTAALVCASASCYACCGAQARYENPRTDYSDYPWTRGRHKAGNKKAEVTDAGTRAMPERVNILLDIDLDDVHLRRNEQLKVQPVFIEGADTVFLPAVDVYGKIRYKYDRRMDFLYGSRPQNPVAYKIVTLGKNAPENVLYDLSVPSDPALYGRRLAVVQDLYGCAGKKIRLGAEPLGVLTPPQNPIIAFIITSAPEPEIREDMITAHIYFPFDRAELQRGFRDNARELGRIDSMTTGILSARGAHAREVAMTGYASPEGPWAYNDGLSRRRMQTIKRYVQDNFGLGDMVSVANVPEDWEGVRRWVENSGLEHRDDVLRIIETVEDPDARDREIRKLDGGATYRTLLRQAYPPLRRVDYRISYEVAPPTVESAREAFRNNPDGLTIYELYMVADSYPTESDDYGTVWMEIARIYPDDHTALHNAAAAAIQQGDYDKARRYIEREKDCPEKLNNLGALAFHAGDYRTAERCFSESAEAGCPEAAANLKNIYYR